MKGGTLRSKPKRVDTTPLETGTAVPEKPKKERPYTTLRFVLGFDADGYRWECPSPFEEGALIVLRYDMVGGFLRENTKSMPGKRLRIVFEPLDPETEKKIEKARKNLS
jgi:hypothetical protein